jgi:hypothetical protein
MPFDFVHTTRESASKQRTLDLVVSLRVHWPITRVHSVHTVVMLRVLVVTIVTSLVNKFNSVVEMSSVRKFR